MSTWEKCAAIAAAVLFCQNAVRADFLTVADPIFSKTLVPLAWQARNDLAPNTWTTDGPLEYIQDMGWQKSGVIVWQNPNTEKHVAGLTPDTSVTSDDCLAIDPNSANWILPYEGCASLSATNGNSFTQTLASTFQAGKSYQLTIAVGHNYDAGYPIYSPAPDVTFLIELFYTDPSHPVVSKEIHNDSATGLSGNAVKDISTDLMPAPGAAIDQHIGILLKTINATTGPASGYFNVTDVRVEEVPEPASLAIMLAGTTLFLRRRRRS